MSGIEEMLAPGEEVILVGHRHPASMWPTFLTGLLFGGFDLWVDAGGGAALSGMLGPLWATSGVDGLVGGWGALVTGGFGTGIGRVLVVAGALMLAWGATVCATTSYVVTARRVLACRGVVSRTVSEMTGNTIRAVGLRRSVTGSVFGYGTVWVHGFAADWVVLPGTTRPMAFLRAIEAVQL